MAPVELLGPTFIAPADNDPRHEEFACGIRFGFSQVLSNVEGGRYAELKRTGSETAELTTFKGSQDFKVGNGIAPTLLDSVESMDNYQILITAK